MVTECFKDLSDDKVIREFLSIEIGDSKNSASFFMNWLRNSNSLKTSGDAFFLEKQDEFVNVENLFDESISTKVRKDNLINALLKYCAD